MRSDSHQPPVTSHLFVLDFASILEPSDKQLVTTFGCGQPVDELSMVLGTKSGSMHIPDFCTHFVRSMWVMFDHYTQPIPQLIPLPISENTPVNENLYTLSTYPTNTSTYSNNLLITNNRKTKERP